MNGEAARLFVTVDAQVNGAVRGLGQVDRAVHNLATTRTPTITPKVDTAPALGAIGKLKSALGGGAGGMAGGLSQGLIGGLVGGASMAMATAGIGAAAAAVTGLATGMIGGAMQMEKYTTQMKVLLGSTEAATARINDLREFANTTPFELPEVVEASKTLQVFTKGALATGEGLRLVGDIASGTGMQFGEAAMWTGRLYDALQSGRPIGEAAMRLQEVGALSGEARARLEKLAESVKKGATSSSEAWSQAAGEFGRYNGMMEQMSQTLEGKASTLSDAWNTMLTKIGNFALPVLKAGIEGVTGAVSLLDVAVTGLTLAWSGQTWEGVPPTLEAVAAGTAKLTTASDIATVGWNTHAAAMKNWVAVASGTVPVAAEEMRGEMGGLWIDLRMKADAASRAMFTAVPTALQREARRLNALALAIPGDLAKSLLADIGRWKSALTALNTVMAESMTRGAKVGYLLAALQSKALVAGLNDGRPEVKEAAQATAAVLVNDLRRLQGDAWVAGYDYGSSAVNGIAAALTAASKTRYNWDYFGPKPIDPKSKDALKGAKEFANDLKGLRDLLGKPLPTGGGGGGGAAVKAVRATREEIDALKASYAALSSTMVNIPDFAKSGAYQAAVKAYAGLGAASKLTGDAGEAAMAKIEKALTRANDAAQAKIAAIQKALTGLQEKFRNWPAMSATAILGALDKVIAKLNEAWRILDAQSKANAIKEAASEVQRAALVAAMPSNVQAIYAQIDAATAEVEKWMTVADAAAAGSAEQREAIKKAIDAQVLLNTLQDAAAKLIEDNAKATADYAQAQADLTEATKAYNQAVAESQEGYVAPTTVETSLAEMQAAQARVQALAGAVAAAAPTVVPVVGAGPALPPALAGTTTTNTTTVNATVNVTGPTLDPYGDFATKLAAALIPGLQKELARQGLSL